MSFDTILAGETLAAQSTLATDDTTEIIAVTPGLRVAVAGFVRTARPKQWIKNVLVLAAPAAAGVLTRTSSLPRALLAVLAFCVVSSGTYFLNDAIDVKADRAHPTKRFRPIAAGIVGVRTAYATGIALMAGAISFGGLINWRLALVLAIYVAVQFAYSFWLKHLPVYDLVAVAAGFLLRAIAGAVAVHVPVSEWFLVVASFGSLLMVTGKRLGEHQELGDGRASHRRSLQAYSPSFLRMVLALSTGGAIIGYALWALSLPSQAGHTHSAIWCEVSIIPLFIALLEYAYLVEGGAGSKPEELVLKDRSLQLLGLVWVVTFALGVYLK
jgi:decaprenyl-phosphate phosphoribosyltransferase